MSNDVFDVFLLRGKEEENGGLTFDPETGLYLRRCILHTAYFNKMHTDKE